jgi:uracil DNA glycosylase
MEKSMSRQSHVPASMSRESVSLCFHCCKTRTQVNSSNFSFLLISKHPTPLSGNDCFLTHTCVYKVISGEE